MDKAVCPYCGSDQYVKDCHKWMYPTLVYDVCQCTKCGMVWKREKEERNAQDD